MQVHTVFAVLGEAFAQPTDLGLKGPEIPLHLNPKLQTSQTPYALNPSLLCHYTVVNTQSREPLNPGPTFLPSALTLRPEASNLHLKT